MNRLALFIITHHSTHLLTIMSKFTNERIGIFDLKLVYRYQGLMTLKAILRKNSKSSEVNLLRQLFLIILIAEKAA